MSSEERFPFAPIEDAARYGSPAHIGAGCPHCSHLGAGNAWGAVCVTIHQVAERLGIGERQLYRYRHAGLTASAADQLAVCLGHHPAEIWPAAWKAVAA